MAIFAIGDLHLSLMSEKPMDIFGGWDNYVERIKENWNNLVKSEDTVVLAGDISWGMSLEESLLDFKFIEELPGKKLILKGNHDYWWNSLTAMKNFLATNNITSIDFIHNNSYTIGDIGICGSRGWLFENGQQHNEKIVNREALRIEASLKSVNDDSVEKVLFLHYPPIFGDQELTIYLDIMEKYSVKSCYYGHIHGNGHGQAFIGARRGINFNMISADYLNFIPLKIR